MKRLAKLIALAGALYATPCFSEHRNSNANGLVVHIDYFERINKGPIRTFLLPSVISIPNAIAQRGNSSKSSIANLMRGSVLPRLTFENKSLLDCVDCMDKGLSTSEFTWQLIRSGTFYGGVQKTLP